MGWKWRRTIQTNQNGSKEVNKREVGIAWGRRSRSMNITINIRVRDDNHPMMEQKLDQYTGKERRRTNGGEREMLL
jgi:hypothetical protein